MFKKTSPEKQLDLFASPSEQMCKRARQKYEDEKQWHNQFFKLVTTQVKEEIFKPLFKDGNMGAPTASVRILVAMSILKEGLGCSDEQLFEKCDFDLLTRAALGLFNTNDACPSLDTYYLFRRRLIAYQEETGRDLMDECFQQITNRQIKMFHVSGKSIRMDSKLIGSNIMRGSRYELVHKTLCKVVKDADLLPSLSDKLAEQVKAYMAEDPTKTVYRAETSELTQKLSALGVCVYKVLKEVGMADSRVALLRRVFEDQFDVRDGGPLPKDRQSIKADSLQSPHDPDCTYRDKAGQKVAGYSTNITETTDEEKKPSLITSVQVETVTHADCDYLEEAVKRSEAVTGSQVENLYADGAYQSPDNRAFAESHGGMQLKTGRMQGNSRFVYRQEGDSLTVTDKRTGAVQTGKYLGISPKRGKRWLIMVDGKKRYCYEDDVRRSELRLEITSLPISEQNKRNNVEATMFQYSFHTRNGKTCYRGLAKHRLQAYSRCLWMNLRRLVIYVVKNIGLPIDNALLDAFWSLLCRLCIVSGGKNDILRRPGCSALAPALAMAKHDIFRKAAF